MDRLSEVSRSVGESSSAALQTSNSYKDNTTALQSFLSEQNLIDESGQLLSSDGQPLTKDGETITVDSYSSLKNAVIDPNTNTFSSDFVENDSFSPEVAKSVVLSEITDQVVAAASSDVPEAISSGLNSLLVGALEIDTTDESAKQQAKELLELSSSLEALASAKPIYKIDPEVLRSLHTKILDQ